jgi:hypothetical protein
MSQILEWSQKYLSYYNKIILKENYKHVWNKWKLKSHSKWKLESLRKEIEDIK